MSMLQLKTRLSQKYDLLSRLNHPKYLLITCFVPLIWCSLFVSFFLFIFCKHKAMKLTEYRVISKLICNSGSIIRTLGFAEGTIGVEPLFLLFKHFCLEFSESQNGYINWITKYNYQHQESLAIHTPFGW